MRVLFDNNVPAPLRRHLAGHEISTAREMNWHELKNGDLLTAAQGAGFEVMLTGDKNLSYQQNLEGRTLAVVVLPTIDWTALRRSPATLSDIAAAVDRAKPGSFEQMQSESSQTRKRGLSLER